VFRIVEEDVRAGGFRNMFYRSWLIAALWLVAVAPAWAQPAIPDTPAGRTFKALVGGEFNSGDQQRMDAYSRK
jgi:hypothetical protein